MFLIPYENKCSTVSEIARNKPKYETSIAE